MKKMTILSSSVVSVLFNEPKLLKSGYLRGCTASAEVSVLFNEPKLLKSNRVFAQYGSYWSFSALQRAEIAEIIKPGAP